MAKRSKERKIVDGFLSGDLASFALLQGWISEVLSLRGWNRTIRDNADDISQEVLVALTKNFREGKYRWQGLKTYVCRITKYTCLDFYDRRVRTTEVPESLASDDDPALEKMVKEENFETLSRILGRLEYRCRKLLALRYYRNLEHRQIAGRLKISIVMSRQWLKRCLDKAREIHKSLENG